MTEKKVIAAEIIVETGNSAKTVGDLKKEIQGVTDTASNAGSKGSAGIGKLTDSFSSISPAAKKATEGAGMLTNALNALIAHPIIAVFAGLVGIVVALFQRFKNMEGVADSLGKAWGTLSGIFDKFINGILTPLIEGFTKLVELFTNGLVSILDTLGISSKKTAERFGEITEALDDLQDAEKDAALAMAESNRKLQEAREIAGDANVPIKERIAALKEAGRIEKEELDKVVKMNQLKAQLTMESIAMELGARQGLIDMIKSGSLEQLKAARAELASLKNVDKEKLYAIDQMIIAAEDAGAKSAKVGKKTQSAITSLEKEEEGKREAERKAAADKRKAAKEKELAEEKKYQQLKSEFTNKQRLADLKNEFDRDAEKVRQDFKKKEEEINLLKISNAKKKELIDLHNKELIAQLNEINAKRLEKINEHNAKVTEDLAKRQAKELEDAAKKAEKEQQAENLRIEKDKKRRFAQAELAKELADQGLTPEQLELQTLQETYEKKYALAKGNEELLLKLKKQYNEDKEKLDELHNQKQLQSLGDSLGKVSEIVGKQTATGKVMAVAEATINTLVAGTNALKAIKTAKSPIEAIAGIATMAAVIAAGFKTVKAITAVQVPGGGGAGGSAPSISAPVLPQAATTTLNQGQINQIGNTAARAFVLETDVSGNQERIKRLNRAARIN